MGALAGAVAWREYDVPDHHAPLQAVRATFRIQFSILTYRIKLARKANQNLRLTVKLRMFPVILIPYHFMMPTTQALS